ncbi:MAG: beta-galactosidase [Bryobacteraceae bacterium]|nr:beta-galactosidase [Bryobacteraceae bacterium]
MTLSRRTLLSMLPAAAALAQAPAAPPARVRPRSPKDIASSPISIGFETLDRKMFDPERTYEHLARVGVKWARCQTGWARTETQKGEYDFAWLDSVVDSLLKIGIQPWFNLGYGNTLYTPGPAHPSAVGWAPMNSDEAKAAWSRYVAKLAERYAGRVKHYEIWNEPNIAGFWQPEKPSPKGYVDLVKLTAPLLRKATPGCTLIGGAFAGLRDWDYFEGCMEEGLGNLVDVISYHPYRAVPEDNYEADLRAFRGLVHRYKAGMPLWQGENGAPSTNNSTGALREFEWDEARQAKWLLRRLLTDLNCDVQVSSYFQTVDMVNYVWATGQSGMTNSKGVLRGTVYTPKAAYYALQNLCTFFDSQAKRADLLLRIEGAAGQYEPLAVRTATFLRGNAPLYAWWFPASLQQGFPTKQTRLTVWSGRAAKLETPVIVDLLTGDITPAQKINRQGGLLQIEGLPLRDYPLLLTDASAV